MVQTFHPNYGRRLSRSEKQDFFGTTGDDDHRGVIQRNGSVAWILVKVGENQTYPNEVERDTVRYCYSSKDGRANAAMKRSFESGSTFMVKVVPDGGVDSYYWGRGRISVLLEDHICNGRNYRRWVIERVDEQDAKRGRYAIAQESSVDACDSQSVVVARRPVDEPAGPIQDTRQNRSHGTVGENDEVAALRLVLGTTAFDSNLERRHAAMMTMLGIKWSRECVTFHNISLGAGRTTSYTPDFTIDIPLGGFVMTYLVEIKPRYPYDDEIRKCVAACRQMKTTPLFLLYNTEFRSPFADGKEGTGQGSYAHHEGVRGMKFSWNVDRDRVIIEHDVAYSAVQAHDGTWFGQLGVRTDVDDVRFGNEALENAYRVASTV